MNLSTHTEMKCIRVLLAVCTRKTLVNSVSVTVASLSSTPSNILPTRDPNSHPPLHSTTDMTATGESSVPATSKPLKTTSKPKKSKPQTKPTANHLLYLLSTAAGAAHSFLSKNDLYLLPSQSLHLESLLASLPFSPSPSPPLPFPSDSFFLRFLRSSYSDFDPRWTHFFRMSKQTFCRLLSLLSPSLLSSLPPSIPPESALAASLFRLSHGASYKSTARRFDLDSSQAACLAFYAVCKALIDKLGNLVEFRRDLERIVVGFGWISLPNCCGVLGFEPFGVDSEALGENGSLLVQALVDSEGIFLDISAGWPSTMKPHSILTQTKLYSGAEEWRDFLNGPCYELSDGNSIPQYIMGQSCFPLLPWLLTPYNTEENFGLAVKEFNAAHSTAMELVRMAFRRVKARWQLLACRWKEECVEFLPFVTVMGCLLHNFLIKCGEPLPVERVGCLNQEEEELPAFEGEVDETGRKIRDSLAKHLSRVSVRR